MSTSTSAKRRQSWRSDGFVGGCVVVAAVAHFPAQHAGDASAKSYDPAAKPAVADGPSKTAVFGRPHGPAHPPGGGGQSDSDA